MWEKCVGCGEGLFAGDSFCGNCGRPVKPATGPVPAAREPEGAAAGVTAAGAGAPGPGFIRIRSAPDARAEPQALAPAGPAAQAPASAAQPAPAGQPAASTGPPRPRPSRTRLAGQAIADPLRNTRYLLQILGQAALFAGIYVLIATTALTLFLIIGFAAIGTGAALRLELDSLAPIALVLAIPFWLIPVPAQLGQWTLLAEGMAEASAMVSAEIRAAFLAHQMPLDSVQPLSLCPPGEVAREYLDLRRGRFRGYLSCFPHGRDLYVGWTFWLRMSPGQLMIMTIGRAARGMIGRGDDIRQALSLEATRALVAAMHSAALAGLAAATGEAAPDGPAGHLDGAGDVALRLG